MSISTSAVRKIFAITVIAVVAATGLPLSAHADPGVIATIPTDGQNYELAYSPDESLLYVTSPYDSAGKSVKVIDTDTNDVITTIRLSSLTGTPRAIVASPDGNFLYVVEMFGNLSDVNKVHEIDLRLSEPTITRTVEVGLQAYSMAITPDGSKLYVTNFYANTVTVVNTSTMSTTVLGPFSSSVSGTPNYTSAQWVSMSPDGSTAFVAFYKGTSGVGVSGVIAIDTSDDTMNAEYTFSADVNDMSTHATYLAVAPDGESVYVANTNTNPANAWIKKLTYSPGSLGLSSPEVTIIPDGLPSPNKAQAMAVSADGLTLFAAYSWPFSRVYAYSTASTDGAPYTYTPGISDSRFIVTPSDQNGFAYVASSSMNVYQIGVGISPRRQVVTAQVGDLVETRALQTNLLGSGQVTYTVSPGSLPAGLSIDPATGVISGTLGEEITETEYTITASNGSESMVAYVVFGPPDEAEQSDDDSLAATGLTSGVLELAGLSLMIVAVGLLLMRRNIA